MKEPFLLFLTLCALPELQRNHGGQIRRLDLYQAFTKSWFNSQFEKMVQHNFDASRFTTKDPKAEILAIFSTYAKALAFEMLLQDTQAIQKPSDPNASFYQFFESSKEAQLGFQGSPLRRIGETYLFIHKSFQEYFAAQKLLDELAQLKGQAVIPADDNTSTDVISAKAEISINPETLQHTNLNQASVVPHLAIRNFMADQVRWDKDLQQTLRNIITASRNHPEISMAAANAITVLNTAQISFTLLDLSRVNIPGADLSYGVFDSTNFEGANLNNVRLRGAWLNHANLNHSHMEGVEFGEQAYLKYKDRVNSCCYSLDGQFFAVACGKNIIIHDKNTLKAINQLTGYKGVVNTLVYSPRSQHLACGSYDKIILWDCNTKQIILSLEGHATTISNVIYSPRGQHMASASQDCTIRIWNCTTSQNTQILTGHNGVSNVLYSPRGQHLAFGSSDNTIWIWDVQKAERTQQLMGHTNLVKSMVYSPRGQHLVSGSWDSTIRVWDIKTGKITQQMTGHANRINTVVCSPRGQHLASASDDKTILVWEIQGENIILQLTGHNGSVTSMAYSPRGQHLASGSYDKTIRVWNCTGDQNIYTQTRPKCIINTIVHSPHSGQHLATGGDGRIQLWDCITGQVMHVLEGSYAVYRPCGKQLTSWGCIYDDRLIKVWHATTGQILLTLTGHNSRVNNVVYSPDGENMASASCDKTIRIWDSNTGQILQLLTGHTNDINNLLYSPQGQQLATSEVGTSLVWDCATGQILYSLDAGHVLYSPRGEHLVSWGAGEDDLIRVWDCKTGQIVQSLRGDHYTCPTNRIDDMVYSPCGQNLAFLRDGLITMVTLTTGKIVLLDYADCISSFTYSPRGKRLVSGGYNQAINIYDVDEGSSKIKIYTKSNINIINWQKDTNFIVSGHSNGLVQSWQLQEKNDSHYLCLIWSSYQDVLNAHDIQIRRIKNLSENNRALLIQRQNPDAIPFQEDTVKEVLVAQQQVYAAQDNQQNIEPQSAVTTLPTVIQENQPFTPEKDSIPTTSTTEAQPMEIVSERTQASQDEATRTPINLPINTPPIQNQPQSTPIPIPKTSSSLPPVDIAPHKSSCCAIQ